MSALCLVIKKETEDTAPIVPEDAQNDTNNPQSSRDTEFVNIKMEMELETPNVRLKEELEPLDDSPPEPIVTTPTMWCNPKYQTQPNNPQKHGITSPNWHEPRIDSKECYPPETIMFNPPLKIVNDIPNNEKAPSKSSEVTNEGSQNYKTMPDGKFACTVCDKTYSTNGNFQRHFLVHSVGPLVCKHCSKTFTTVTLLQRHVKIHGTYDCDVCGKVFKTSSNLFQHKRIHMTVKPFKCPLCSKEFTVRANLMKHQGKSRCKADTGPITCKICNKIFKTDFLLKSHLRRHNTDKPFNCDICDMNFKYKSTVIRHVQLHNGIRPYSCEVCHKSFTHISLLKPHMRTHTGEKPFPCPICNKSFAHKHNMERHAIRHTKEKKTVCEICNKKFPKESRLKYHLRTHVDEKFFKCMVCPKKFSHRQNVLRHYSRKHPNATYDCTDTDAKVASKVWEDVLNNKLTFKDRNDDGNDKNDDKLVKNEIDSHPEEILPDLDRSPTVNSKKTVKNNITNTLNEEIDCDDNKLNVNCEIKQEIDSDDEFLAKYQVRATKRKFVNETENSYDNKDLVNDSKINEALPKDNGISMNNTEVSIKKEIVSDDEEILPDTTTTDVTQFIEIKIEREAN